ncbi:hypothetical protein RFI_30330, partial [Reticulomyxa filosa]
MGIKNLSKLIAQLAPNAIKQTELTSYGKKHIAVDASIMLYRYLTGMSNLPSAKPAAESKLHLLGILHQTVEMKKNKIKPVWVFDGKAPDFKKNELDKRAKNREKANQEKIEAEKRGDKKRVAQLEKRLIKLIPDHIQECKELLDNLGEWKETTLFSFFLKKEDGVVYGCATEDMDALPFRTPRLMRHMAFKDFTLIEEYNLEEVLQGMGLSYDQFVDMCILCGCDYVPSIRGIGPKRAYKFIKKYGNIETILEHIKTPQFQVPENFLYEPARELFRRPLVWKKEEIHIEWKEPNKELVLEFLVKKKGVNEQIVVKRLKQLNEAEGIKKIDEMSDIISSVSKLFPSSLLTPTSSRVLKWLGISIPLVVIGFGVYLQYKYPDFAPPQGEWKHLGVIYDRVPKGCRFKIIYPCAEKKEGDNWKQAPYLFDGPLSAEGIARFANIPPFLLYPLISGPNKCFVLLLLLFKKKKGGKKVRGSLKKKKKSE